MELEHMEGRGVGGNKNAAATAAAAAAVVVCWTLWVRR